MGCFGLFKGECFYSPEKKKEGGAGGVWGAGGRQDVSQVFELRELIGM